MEEITEKDNDEISLIDLFATILRYKVIIIVITVLGMIGVVVYSIFTIILPPEKSPNPNVYTSTAQILISESTSGSSMASLLNSSGLGSLAGMVGVSVPTGTSNSGLASYLVSSSAVLDDVIKMFNLTERYEIKSSPNAKTRSAVRKVLTTNLDEDSGVFSISFTDTDPVFAKEVVNYTVKLLGEKFNELNIDTQQITQKNLKENINTVYNKIMSLQNEITELENSVSDIYNPYSATPIAKDSAMLALELSAQKEIYKQLKAQDELLKVELASEKPVFQVLQYGEVPDIKSGPSRGTLCIIVSFVSFVGAILLAFLLNGIKNLKNNKEIIAKLKGR